MAFITDYITLKPVKNGWSLCISGALKTDSDTLVLRIDGLVHEASITQWSLDKDKEHPGGRVIRATLDYVPESADIVLDGMLDKTYNRKELQPMPAFSQAMSGTWNDKSQTWNVSGWVFYDDKTPVQIRLLDEQGKELKKIPRIPNPQVQQQYGLNDLACGFEFDTDTPDAQVEYSWGEYKETEPLRPYLQGRFFASSLHRMKQGWNYLSKKAKKHSGQASAPAKNPYQTWFENQRPDGAVLQEQAQTKFNFEPKISLICFITGQDLERAGSMIQSVLNQSYANWELCLADASGCDHVKQLVVNLHNPEKIRYKKLDADRGMANGFNEALSLADGDYIGLLGGSDILEPDALYEAAKTLQNYPAEMLYTDHDEIDMTGEDGTLSRPHFKPDFSWEYLYTHNYISRFLVVANPLMKTLMGFDARYEGASDYDFILRAAREADGIVHIPKVLYHARIQEDERGQEARAKAARAALQAHFSRLQIPARVKKLPGKDLFEVQYLHKQKPFISILSLTMPNHLDSLLEQLSKDGYKNYEVISVNPKQEFKNPADFINQAAKAAHGDLILYLGPDTTPVPGTLGCMASLAMQPDAGMVGGALMGKDHKLKALGGYYRDGNIHMISNSDIVRSSLASPYSVLPFDGFMIKRNEFLAKNGLDISMGAGALADYCLRDDKASLASSRVKFSVRYVPELDDENIQVLKARYPKLEERDPYWNIPAGLEQL